MNLLYDLSTFQNPVILSTLQQLPRLKTAEEKRQLRRLMNEVSFEDLVG